MDMANLPRLSNAKTRSISPENFTGEKGKAGMATEGTGKSAARELGQGWKVSPSVRIPAKSTFTMGEINGPGVIQQIWMTPAPLDKTQLYILRFYWDGETTPSVEVPMSHFFACGWGKYAQINSLPICVNPGSAFNSYWPMPFRKSAKITMENLDDKDMTLYYQINYTLTEVPENTGYFHAQYRRESPLKTKGLYTILDGVQGQGQYVGTYLAWEVHSPGWWGEGEIKFYLDGDKEFPTICGTGTEDYFCGSYDFDTRGADGKPHYTPFSTPYTGLIQVAATGQTRRSRPAIRAVPLAHRRPGPVRQGPARDDPGPRLAIRRPLSAGRGRHRVGRLLVPDRAARGVPQAARCRGSESWPHSRNSDRCTGPCSPTGSERRHYGKTHETKGSSRRISWPVSDMQSTASDVEKAMRRLGQNGDLAALLAGRRRRRIRERRGAQRRRDHGHRRLSRQGPDRRRAAGRHREGPEPDPGQAPAEPARDVRRDQGQGRPQRA